MTFILVIILIIFVFAVVKHIVKEMKSQSNVDDIKAMAGKIKLKE